MCRVKVRGSCDAVCVCGLGGGGCHLLIAITKPWHSWSTKSITPAPVLVNPQILGSVWAKSPPPPRQMWPSRVWWSLPGLTQQAAAEAIVQDLAAQQESGRSRMSGVFEEKLTAAEIVGIVVMYWGEKGRGSGWGRGAGPQSSSLIKIFNTSERPPLRIFEEDKKRRLDGWFYTPNLEVRRRNQGERKSRLGVRETNDSSARDDEGDDEGEENWTTRQFNSCPSSFYTHRKALITDIFSTSCLLQKKLC